MNWVPGTRAWRIRRYRALCLEVASHIDLLVDGELPPTRKAKLLEHHLTGCNHCRGEAEVVRALKRGVARVAQDADQEMVERLHKLARRLCSGEDCDTS